MNPKFSLGSPSSEVWATASLTQKVLVRANKAWGQGLWGGAGGTERERHGHRERNGVRKREGKRERRRETEKEYAKGMLSRFSHV